MSCLQNCDIVSSSESVLARPNLYIQFIYDPHYQHLYIYCLRLPHCLLSACFMTDIYICLFSSSSFFPPPLMLQACWHCPCFNLCNSVWWSDLVLKFYGGVCFQLVMNFYVIRSYTVVLFIIFQFLCTKNSNSWTGTAVNILCVVGRVDIKLWNTNAGYQDHHVGDTFEDTGLFFWKVTYLQYVTSEIILVKIYYNIPL
jgi:hypothetical protein